MFLSGTEIADLIESNCPIKRKTGRLNGSTIVVWLLKLRLNELLLSATEN